MTELTVGWTQIPRLLLQRCFGRFKNIQHSRLTGRDLKSARFNDKNMGAGLDTYVIYVALTGYVEPETGYYGQILQGTISKT